MGGLEYRVVEGWEGALPEGFTHNDVVGLGVDSRDRLFALTRGQARVLIFDRDGTYAGSWGEGFLTERTHGLTIAPDDSVFVVDEGSEVVYKFTPDGDLLLTIGNKGVASDTGYDGSTIESIARGGPPFNRPTNVAIAPSGELYVSDGYGNARVHRFSASGELLQSWGEPGNGPGQFHLSHGVAVAPDGRVFVADRENDRVQIFDADGRYLDEWRQVQRPTNVEIGADGRVYVSELWWRPGDRSLLDGSIPGEHPGRVSVLDLGGNVLARWGGPDRCAPGNFVAPHDICVDSRGDVYVGEVTWTFGIRPGHVPEGCHSLQKFTPTAG